MTHALYTRPKFLGDKKSNQVNDLDLNQSTIACYHFPSLSKLANGHSSLPIPFDETRHYKRLKQVPSDDEYLYSGGGSTSTNISLSSLPRLQFRDHIWAYNQRYLAIEAMEEATAVKLVQQLIACAEAVACCDKAHASTLFSMLRANALVFGTSSQRVASCFVQGLSERLAMVQPLGAKEEASVYDICPQIQFSHFLANASILEAFEGESSVHVVDLGMTLGLPHGHQWRKLIHSLANRAGKPVNSLRITGVGNCGEPLQAIGYELELYAKSLGLLNFEFLVVESNLETLKPEHFKIVDGEILVINSILQLHCVVKESRGALNSVLQILHELSPKLFVLVEQDSSHNGPFFLGRFMEALHYYSAIFDSLDTMLPRYDTRHAKIEQFFLAEEIKNIVSCEGPARVERHERVDQWRRRMSRAGFQMAPLKMITQAKQWLRKGCLVLGWKSKPIIAASCWEKLII
ncbi:GRAS family protein RAD1-like [Fagus crenata]